MNFKISEEWAKLSPSLRLLLTVDIIGFCLLALYGVGYGIGVFLANILH